MKHVIATLFAVGLLALAVSCTSGGGLPNPLPQIFPGTPAITQGEQDLIDMHNAARTANGLPAFTEHAQLSEVAQNHANYLANEGELSHEDANGDHVEVRATAVGYPWTGISENIGFDYETQRLFNGWMGSPGHKANILHTGRTEIGVGMAKRDIYMYYVVVFGDR